MARIAGVNIPTQKRVEIALTYIHGIGRAKAVEICSAVGIPSDRRVNALTDDEVVRIREAIDRGYIVEGDLLVTSGLGGAFPAGYPVAVVDSVTLKPQESFAEVSARPSAQLDQVREIMLIWVEDSTTEAVASDE